MKTSPCRRGLLAKVVTFVVLLASLALLALRASASEVLRHGAASPKAKASDLDGVSLAKSTAASMQETNDSAWREATASGMGGANTTKAIAVGTQDEAGATTAAEAAAMPPYAEEEAVALASLATASYCAAGAVAAWRCGPPCLGGMETVHVASHAASKAFAFVGRFREECVVSFRGTHSGSQWMQNLASSKQIQLPHCSFGGVQCRVGMGFLNQYLSIKDEVLKGLRAADCQPSANITFVGHSLGGVLAHLAAHDLHRHGYVPAKVYTFGQARAGNRAFANAMWSLLQGRAYYRIALKDDPVVHLPAHDQNGNEWVHPGREVYYWAGTNEGYRVCDHVADGFDPQCSGHKPQGQVSKLMGICNTWPQRCRHYDYLNSRMPFRSTAAACGSAMSMETMLV